MITPTTQGGWVNLLSWTKASYTAGLVVPPNECYILRWCYLRYAADVTVITRSVQLRLTLVTANYMPLIADYAIVASVVSQLYYMRGTQTDPNGPGLILYPGQRLEVSTGNPQAGDDWMLEGVYHVLPAQVA